MMAKCNAPRDHALLSQALRHQTGAYADLTQADMNAAPDMSHVQSMFGALLVQLQTRPIEVPPENGTFEEYRSAPLPLTEAPGTRSKGSRGLSCPGRPHDGPRRGPRERTYWRRMSM